MIVKSPPPAGPEQAAVFDSAVTNQPNSSWVPVVGPSIGLAHPAPSPGSDLLTVAQHNNPSAGAGPQQMTIGDNYAMIATLSPSDDEALGLDNAGRPVNGEPRKVGLPVAVLQLPSGPVVSVPIDQRRKRKRTCAEWFRKYFCSGQIKAEQFVNKGPPPEGKSKAWVYFCWRRPYWVTWMLPLFIVYSVWLSFMAATDGWGVFGDNNGTQGYYMTIVMIFGSFVAGATSEGGGSVAFPIMTLVLGLRPKTARDFSLMIQSVGMTSASFTIFYSQIVIEHAALVFSTLGGAAGMVFGLYVVAPALPDDYSKMVFVSVWLAFAINLGILNREKKRRTNLTIQNPDLRIKLILTFVGFIGGILSSIAGSGIDICSFSVLTLYFRLTEKTATPTSVLLMAINTCFGFLVRGAIMQDIDPQTWNFWLAAVPAVCVGAPFGAFVSSFMHRQVLASFVYVTDTVQFVAACILTKMTVPLASTTVAIILVCLGLFHYMRQAGASKLQASTYNFDARVSIKLDNVSAAAPGHPAAGAAADPTHGNSVELSA